MARGIIAAPAAYIGQGAMLKTERGISAQELRYFLLYWDKIVIPTNNLVHVAIPSENEFLSTGIVERPVVPFSGTFNGEGIARAQAFAQSKIARELIESDKKIDWVIHQIGDRFNLGSQDVVERQAVRVDLINVLPVPNDEVPIPDILEFKERRKDELGRLHSTIDDMYLEILSSPDKEFKSKKVVSELESAMSDLEKVSLERWKNTRKYDLTAELNVCGKDLAISAATGALVSSLINPASVPIGALVGFAASFIKVSAKATHTFEPAKNKSVFGYLAQAHKEKIL